MAPASLSSRFQYFTPLPTIKLGSSGAGSRVGGLVHPPRPLWVSPTTSPVRLGVSPAAAPTPTGAFNQRFEALFPGAGALGFAVCFAPRRSSRFICARMWGHGVLPTALPALFSATLSPALPVYLCANVGPQGLLVVRQPALLVPHSARATRVLSSPAARLRPSYRSGCMFLFYLLGVGLPCRLIFCQFWLCQEAQCVYLSLIHI